MILIEKDTAKDIDLTLNEKSVYYNNNVQPYFLFIFQSETDPAATIKFTAEDTSTQPDRYNRFRIRETPTSDLLNGRIYMTGNTSQWTYEVYESATQFSASTLDVSYTTGKIIEKGRVQLKGNDTNINDIYK